MIREARKWRRWPVDFAGYWWIDPICCVPLMRRIVHYFFIPQSIHFRPLYHVFLLQFPPSMLPLSLLLSSTLSQFHLSITLHLPVVPLCKLTSSNRFSVSFIHFVYFVCNSAAVSLVFFSCLLLWNSSSWFFFFGYYCFAKVF